MLLVGAGGPVALQTSPPVRSRSRVDTDPHAALRALLVGLRPPTPQSPERLRSTPFDCVAIAPCCFAKRKAVLSHALAALTALNKCASQAGREALAAQDADDKMGHSAVHEYLQTLRRWYKVKRREAPPSQPTCSSGALRSVGCFGCANSRLSSVIVQKQMCAKYRTLPIIMLRKDCTDITEYIMAII